MAASSIPAMEAGDLTIRECVSTIHSPAWTTGELTAQYNRPVITCSSRGCMAPVTALPGPASKHTVLHALLVSYPLLQLYSKKSPVSTRGVAQAQAAGLHVIVSAIATGGATAVGSLTVTHLVAELRNLPLPRRDTVSTSVLKHKPGTTLCTVQRPVAAG